MEAAFLVLTVLLSSAAAGCATYRLNVSKEQLWFTGRKAEELYCVVEALERELSNLFGSRYSLLGDERRASGPQREDLQKAGAHFVTAKMLVGFYFPTLAPALARALAAVTTAHAGLGTWEEAAKAERDRHLIGLDNAVTELKDALEALKAAVIEKGRLAHLGSPFARLWPPAMASHAGRVLQVPA